jgi:predicted ATPase/DNA-binding SARP family transcriptional activator
LSGDPAPRVQLLGTARLHQGGLSQELPDTATGYLLAALAARGDWMARDELAALFWPEAAAEDAQRNLRVTLNRLVQRLADWGVADALARERRRLCWLPGSDVAQARAARSAGDWQRVLALSQGPFAVGLGFRGFPVLAEWADGERRALAALAREAVLRCAALAPPAQAAQLAARQLEAEPADEDLMRLRLQALAALGRHGEAAREFAAFDAQLRRELGVGASPALTAVVARLTTAGTGPAEAAAGDDGLVGREDELARARLLLREHRLLTLLGLGGVGKTRLAQAVAEAASALLWLPLADTGDVSELPHRVLQALRPAAAPVRDAKAAAGEHLARSVQLLVLDNVEQLLGQRAALLALLSQWLAAAPSLRLLVTSRQALQHPAEALLPLRTLALPPPGGEPLAAPAVRLLVARARRARPGFDPRDQAGALAEIASSVGGLPLALRLAAEWLRLLSPADVLAALQRSVGALDGAEGQGLQATLDRSWQLLDEPARAALAALSVFVSPFGAEDALQAGAADLPQLARLSEHGLLEARAEAAPDAKARLQLHPLVRAFAAEQLARDAAAASSAHARHAAWVQRRLAVWANWRLVDQGSALRDVALLLPEALAAWHWAREQGCADFIAEAAPVLLNYWEKVGRWAEGIALFEAAEPGFDEQVATDRAALAALWRGRALLLYRDGRFEPAAALAQRALEAARSLGHQQGIKANLNTLALAHWMLGQLDTAEAAAAEARDLAAADGDRASVAVFSGTLALLHKKRGRYADAEASWRRALAVHREVGNWSSACVTLNNLGNLLRLTGRADEAVAVLDESLRLCDAYGFASSRPFALINLAQAHLAAGRLEAAEPLALQALAEGRRAGERMLEAGTLLLLAEAALHAGRPALCAERLAPALRLARALNDPANLLEALSAFARWQLALGRTDEAARTVATVRTHPALHAELGDDLQRAPLAALPPAAPLDLLVLVEQASAALAG